MTLEDALKTIEVYASSDVSLGEETYFVAERIRAIQALLERWKEFSVVVNDPNSPSILIECIQELENELEFC